MSGYQIMVLLLLFVFYFMPIVYFIRFKLKTIFAVFAMMLLGVMIGSPEETFLIITACLIIDSLYRKSLPFELKDNIYDFKFSKLAMILPMLILVKCLTTYVAFIIVKLINFFGYHDESKQAAVTQVLESNSLFLTFMLFVTACIIAPITEEFSIRYFLYGYILKDKFKFNMYLAAIISSMIFALMHDSLYGIVNAFVAGLFLTWVYQKYGLGYAIATHFIFNLIAFIAIVT